MAHSNEPSNKEKSKGPPHGPLFFIVNKPVGISSFDIIRIFKKNLSKRIGKIGHLGTLDPFANGLMLIGIGGSTRLNDFTQDFSKEYIATGLLGVKSETGDVTALPEQFFRDEAFKPSAISLEMIKDALNSFLGKYMQAPHKYSAAKFEGKNLYEWAREGVAIEKPKVEREIFEVEFISYIDSQIKFRVKCSSGTFIRVMFEDLAQKLGTFGHLTELTRSQIGHINLDDAFSLEEFSHSDFNEDDFIKNFANPVEKLVPLGTVTLNTDETVKFSRGQPFFIDLPDGFCWVLGSGHNLGLGKIETNRLLVCINFSQIYELS